MATGRSLRTTDAMSAPHAFPWVRFRQGTSLRSLTDGIPASCGASGAINRSTCPMKVRSRRAVNYEWRVDDAVLGVLIEISLVERRGIERVEQLLGSAQPDFDAGGLLGRPVVAAVATAATGGALTEPKG